MTLAERYREIMDRVELSAEARARIFDAVREDTGGAAGGKTVAFPVWRRYAALAACLAVVLLGALALPRFLSLTQTDPGVMPANPRTVLSSAEELADTLGFPVEEIAALPFAAEETEYVCLSGKIAEIDYRGGTRRATLRKAEGDDDISGDYTSYAETADAAVGPLSVTLRGDGGTVSLALWQADGFTCALRFEPGVTPQEAVDAVGSLYTAAEP